MRCTRGSLLRPRQALGSSRDSRCSLRSSSSRSRSSNSNSNSSSKPPMPRHEAGPSGLVVLVCCHLPRRHLPCGHPPAQPQQPQQPHSSSALQGPASRAGQLSSSRRMQLRLLPVLWPHSLPAPRRASSSTCLPGPPHSPQQRQQEHQRHQQRLQHPGRAHLQQHLQRQGWHPRCSVPRCAWTSM
jgi:hypothetical protein